MVSVLVLSPDSHGWDSWPGEMSLVAKAISQPETGGYKTHISVSDFHLIEHQNFSRPSKRCSIWFIKMALQTFQSSPQHTLSRPYPFRLSLSLGYSPSFCPNLDIGSFGCLLGVDPPRRLNTGWPAIAISVNGSCIKFNPQAPFRGGGRDGMGDGGGGLGKNENAIFLLGTIFYDCVTTQLGQTKG